MSQGEGETCGVAVERAMNTVVIIELLEGITTPWPRKLRKEWLPTRETHRGLHARLREAAVLLPR